MRILIAEDDLTSRTVLTALLKKSGHEVVETINGVEAWNVMQQPDAPALAILDWMMPEMDGLEVVRKIRTLQTNRPPYIIMLTTKDKKTDIISGLNEGANDYLAKPFDIGELRARVEVGLRMVNMQDSLIESRKALFHQATHDPLTGLLNRRAILDRLHKELARARRHENLLIAGMCDIDHFKHVNDTHGHQTGDDVLRGLTQILTDNIREFDSAGRMGGEEFLLVMPMKTSTDYKSLFARLCKRISETEITTRSGELSVTVSIGVACATPESTVDNILEASDTALYQAKKEGRNRVVYHKQ